MELCCSVNGNRKCNHCRKSFCEQHAYQITQFALRHEYSCYECYDIYVRRPMIEAPRKGMTFAELYLAVRKVTPTGYISINVKIQDHRPGVTTPELQWEVYHDKYAHSEGKTPEQVLANFKAKIAAWEEKASPIANVNI